VLLKGLLGFNMTNGLFDPSFRGAGSPGAPGVGSTQRGLQLVAQGRNTLQQQGLGLESKREARVGERDQARIQSLIRGATLLKQIQDPRQKIEFLRGRVGELRRAGISSSDSEEALSLAEAGDFAGLEQVTDEAIALGQSLSGGAERFSPTTVSLPDGTTIQTTSTGRKVVTDAAGNKLEGKKAIDAIKASQAFKTETQIGRAGGKAEAVIQAKLVGEPELAATTQAAKDAIKQSTKIFERLEPLQTNLVNIDDAIRLIDEGAKSGPILSKLPSIRKSSIELDTLQKKLGLDVISSTTFGALSEGEREFALSTALPSTLKPQDLKLWLQRKKITQEKLIAQLQDASVFLGTPGNTISDFIELKKLETLEQESQGQESQAGGALTSSGGIQFTVE
jgi:hypothetical protein